MPGSVASGTLCINILSTVKIQLYKNNKLTSYILRTYRGHLQTYIGNVLGSIQIMCGREISLVYFTVRFKLSA